MVKLHCNFQVDRTELRRRACFWAGYLNYLACDVSLRHRLFPLRNKFKEVKRQLLSIFITWINLSSIIKFKLATCYISVAKIQSSPECISIQPRFVLEPASASCYYFVGNRVLAQQKVLKNFRGLHCMSCIPFSIP